MSNFQNFLEFLMSNPWVREKDSSHPWQQLTLIAFNDEDNKVRFELSFRQPSSDCIFMNEDEFYSRYETNQVLLNG